MRKLIMKMSVTVDGFVSDLIGANEWIFKTGDDKSLAWSVGQTSEAGLIIMGRKSFEMMAPYWPTATGPFAAPMNSIPKAVFTQKGFKGMNTGGKALAQLSAAEASWASAQIFDGNLAENVRMLKAGEGRPIVAIGGAALMRNLIATGLVDEYLICTHPVALGAGLPIFSGLGAPLYLRLADVKQFPSGVVVHHYLAPSV